jgi:hypothetical protein
MSRTKGNFELMAQAALQKLALGPLKTGSGNLEYQK